VSSEELVSAYLDGQISRRTLVRRLIAAGVSLGAAVSYTHLLAPQRAAAYPLPGHYPQLSIDLLSTSLSQVIADPYLVVRVAADEDLQLTLTAYRLRHREGLEFLGARGLSFVGPDSKKVHVHLTRHAVNHLASVTQAEILITAYGTDDDGYHPAPEATGTLS